MSRYVLKFTKKGNMRFISHLDLQRLFRRALNRADISLVFSQGFNPHPMTNIVMPLSLGFEAETDYFEFESKDKLLISRLITDLNQALPEGIKFFECKEIPHEKKNLSSICQCSEFKVLVPAKITEKDIKLFLAQPSVNILKRDKKTKQYVEKDIKSWITSILVSAELPEFTVIDMILRAAPNETVNPLQLTESLLKFLNIKFVSEDIRITRMELYYLENGKLKPLFERDV